MSKISIKGRYKITFPDGSVVEGTNLVVDAGLNLAALRLVGAGPGPVTHMAVGDSDVSPAAGQTGLQGAQLGTRPAVTNVVTANEVTISALFTAAAPWTIKEFGLFTASAGGTMLARFICAATPILAGNTFTVDWTLELR